MRQRDLLFTTFLYSAFGSRRNCGYFSPLSSSILIRGEPKSESCRSSRPCSRRTTRPHGGRRDAREHQGGRGLFAPDSWPRRKARACDHGGRGRSTLDNTPLVAALRAQGGRLPCTGTAQQDRHGTKARGDPTSRGWPAWLPTSPPEGPGSCCAVDVAHSVAGSSTPSR
jgi:hypothetical protein